MWLISCVAGGVKTCLFGMFFIVLVYLYILREAKVVCFIGCLALLLCQH